MSTTVLTHYGALSRRVIFNTLRQPTAIVPAMLFPLIFMALSSAAFERSIGVPGFPPVDSFLQFLVCTTIVQGSLFGSISAGSDMATDIEGGFFERLIASPAARTPILVARVTGAAVLAFVQAWVFFGVAHLFGMRSEGGFVSLLMVAVAVTILAAGTGSIAVAFALKTGSSEAVQGSFPLLFTLLFFSSAFFPRNLMEGWFQTVAGINPLSHLIEGLREQVTVGLDPGSYGKSLLVAAGIFVFGMSLGGLALRGRLAMRH